MSTLPSRLADVLHRIDLACDQAGLARDRAQLIAVSKTFPAEDVLRLLEAGQTHFGENYVQEGLAKSLAVSASLSDHAPRPIWHFIGPLQSNKTRDVAETFDWVHTIDRLKIAQRLAQQRPPGRPPLALCIQVNVSAEPSKSGVFAHELPALALEVGQLAQACGRVTLRGLMAIPEPSSHVAKQREAFATLRTLKVEMHQALLSRGIEEQCAPMDVLSMGMSTDLESAIAESDPEGTTLLRVGSALFGERR